MGLSRRLRWLALRRNRGGGSDPVAEYQAAVLATNPLAYWPMQETSGTAIEDATGNSRGGTIVGDVTLGQTGQVGKAYSFPGLALNDTNMLKCVSALSSALDNAEYSISMLIKVNVDSDLQVRAVNMYSDSMNDYSALEIRTGDLIGIYLNENANQNITSSLFPKAPDEEWILLTFFNSESTGETGIYFNKELYAVPRTLTGVTGDIVDTYPTLGMQLGGLMQHVIFWNRRVTQEEVNALHAAAFGTAEPAWTLAYAFQDEFVVDDDAPITSPRDSGLTATDTGNKFSITGGNCTWSTRTVDSADPRLVSAAFADWVPGRACITKVKHGTLYIGWSQNATASPTEASFGLQGTSLLVNPGGGQMTLGAVVAGTDYLLAMVQRRRRGVYYLIKGGTFTNWTLVYASETDRRTYYVGFGPINQNAATYVDYLRVCNLPSSFRDHWGLATERLPGLRAANDAFTHTADGGFEFTVYALPSDGLIDMRFRRQDATNDWQVTVDASGNIKLNEIVSGTPTERGSSNGAISAGERMYIHLSGTTIRVTESNATRITYTSATNFATATAGLLAGLGTGGKVADIASYPATIPAALAAYLDQAAAA